MKLIVAGSRTITPLQFETYAIPILDKLEISEIISGRAKGVDTYGELYAKERKISLAYFPANWSKFGRAAGVYRNCDMGDYADEALLLWDGESKGTLHMLNYMRKINKKVCLIEIYAAPTTQIQYF